MKRVLCPMCGKPIHIDDFGGVMKNSDGVVEFYHSICIILKVMEL